MARGVKAQPEERKGDFVLERNFGWVDAAGHHFLQAGRELNLQEDGDLIGLLHRLGAPLKAL